MLLAEGGCVLMGFFLLISGGQGQVKSICALKGSSVDLPCSVEYPTSSMKWYTVHWDGDKHVLNKVSADGNHVPYNMNAQGNFTLTLNHLQESDTNFYCCRDDSDPAGHCWFYRTKLHVADLQVEVIPTTEGQTVSLMCSTSCPLTENPAAYIWYKNGEFLYEDWSPWYQELVSSEEAVRYSCAVKGYEDLRAPDVSVDSVTTTCFNVTYAKGTMCSYEQKSEDEPCTITYPTELYIQRTPIQKQSFMLTCMPSCPLKDPQTNYRWYWNKRFNKHFEGQQFVVDSGDFSCALKSHEDLLSAEVCPDDKDCLSVNYVSRRICALQGSSVNIFSKHFYPTRRDYSESWYKIKRSASSDAERLTGGAGRLEYHDHMNGSHILRITNLSKDDSAEYIFRLQDDDEEDWDQSDSPGVTLVVTGLKVTMTPSSVVTEGQRVTLTCSTSCPLSDNTNYIWYLNSRPLTQPENQHKHLVLDPVSSQHAGSYSCAVKSHKDIRAREEALTVRVSPAQARIQVIRLTASLLIPIPLLLFHLWLRKKKTPTSTTEPNGRRERSTHKRRCLIPGACSTHEQEVTV